jgi:transcriptional regulator NrdR family protein
MSEHASDSLGISCPVCGCRLLNEGGRSVVYTRKGTQCIRRVRVCNHCGRRFATVERVVAGRKSTPV